MTTHPEDAMTRERALEDALRPFAKFAEAREKAWQNLSDEHAFYGEKYPVGHNLTIGNFRRARALASAQQEPAPAADAEEVAAWRSMATAPRKDGTRILIKDSDYIGVYCYSSGNDIYDFRTWQPESNERRGHIFANDYGERYCKWLPLDLLAELGAARAKSGEKGGAR